MMTNSPYNPATDDANLKGNNSSEERIPAANITSASLSTQTVLGSSRMWLLTLLCLVIAIAIVWWSIPERGLTISIHFPEGHGLQVDDVVRFRGIDVGTVERVQLNSDLSAIDVQVNLRPFAEPLAHKGTRFWIVRPAVGFSGISGLETAVGNKYIGLMPGDPNAPRQFYFEGLPSEPPDALENEGMEITLRGEKRYSVSEGAPVNCRGVNVGRVLSVGLSRDARNVDFRIRIFENYRKLITTKTKFWATSGVDLDFSLGGGLKLETESLETIARGGITLLVTEGGGTNVNPGHVFELYKAPEDAWFESARSVRLTGLRLTGALPMKAAWTTEGLFGNKKKEATFVGIPFRDANARSFVLVPKDMLLLPPKGLAGSLRLFGPNETQEIEPPVVEEISETAEFIRVPVPGNFSEQWIDSNSELRWPTNIENCLAVRSIVDNSGLTFLDYPIDDHQLAVDDASPENWFMNRFDGDRNVWHGAPVLAAEDGKLIGALYVLDHQATIVRFGEELNLD